MWFELIIKVVLTTLIGLCLMKAPFVIVSNSSNSESSEGDQFDEGSTLYEQKNVLDFSENKAHLQFVFERISVHVSIVGFMIELSLIHI